MTTLTQLLPQRPPDCYTNLRVSTQGQSIIILVVMLEEKHVDYGLIVLFVFRHSCLFVVIYTAGGQNYAGVNRVDLNLTRQSQIPGAEWF